MAALPVALPAMQALVVDSPSMLERVISTYLARNKPIFADTETTGLDERVGKLVAVQLWQGVGVPVIVDAREMDVLALQMLEHLTWTFHNAQFDINWLRANGVRISKVWDTQIAEQVIYGVGIDEKKSGIGLHLKDLALRYCEFDMPKEARNWFIDLDTRPEEWDKAFPTEQIEYMANDVLYLPTIAKAQTAKIRELGLTKVAALEMRVTPALAQMRSDGVLVNVDGWREVIHEKEGEAEQLENELLISDLALAIQDVRNRRYQSELDANTEWRETVKEAEAEAKARWEYAAGGMKWGEYKKQFMAAWRAEHQSVPKPPKGLLEINLGSPQQLKDGLRELGIELEDTEAETLERASVQYPVLTPLLLFRRAEKFSTTYGESLLAHIATDGRIHSDYNQIVGTGRMSGRRPNFQNIPARTTDGKRLRHCVIAPDGWKLLVADMPNAEMRIIAEMSGCKPMLEMFESGMDMHTFTARRMFNLPDSMTDEEVKEYRLTDGPLKGLLVRDIAKTINFGSAYGQSEYGFAAKFSVTVEEAREFKALWDEAFTGLKDWFAMQADSGLRMGYSVTMMGRRRVYRLPARPAGKYDYEKPEWKLYSGIRSSIKRQAMNHPIQGTNADMTKFAVADLHEYIVHWNLPWRMPAVVHDEIVLEVPDDDVELASGIQASYIWDAMHRFLKRVDIPPIKVHVGQYWEH